MALPPCIFDLDGVLVDSAEPIGRSVNVALESFGLPPAPPERLRRCIGPPLTQNFTELLAERGADAGLVTECIVRYREAYRIESLVSSRLYDGMEDVLLELGAVRTLGIATSKTNVFTDPILEQLGITHHFAVVYGPAYTDLKETKTGTLGRALDALGVASVARRDCTMVGDRRHDIEAAHALGLRSVGVTWGFGSLDELEQAGAGRIVDSPAALLALLLAD